MDESTCIRVKLKFRDKIKKARLDSKVDSSLSSVANLRRLVFKNFPEIEDMVNVQEASSWRKAPATPAVLELKYQDSIGDFTTLENDQGERTFLLAAFGIREWKFDTSPNRSNLILVPSASFRSSTLAMPGSPFIAPSGSFRGSTYAMPGTSSKAPSASFLGSTLAMPGSPSIYPSASFRGSTYAMPGCREPGYRDHSEGSSNRISDHSRGKEVQCRHFQRGHCKSSSTCRFSHDSEASLASNLSRTVTIRSQSPLVDSTQQARTGFDTQNSFVRLNRREVKVRLNRREINDMVRDLSRREVNDVFKDQIESLNATENIEELSQEKVFNC